jgi:hypothetical protein
MRSLTDAELRARVLVAVAAEPSMTRAQGRRWTAGLLLVGALAGLAVFQAWGGVRPHARPLALLVATASGSGLLAGLALIAAFGRGRSMLGRSRLVLAATIGLLPPALLGWKVWVSSLYPAMTDPWPDRPGFRCLALGLAVGAFPLLASLVGRRRTLPVRPGSTGAAVGAASGVAAATLVDLWCPIAHLPHLLLGHLLPIALLAAAGAVAGARILAPRFAR